MRHYETIYIVNPNLGQEEYREVVNRYSALIERNKGVIIKVEEWGIQRLAYEIRKFDKGGYILLDYCANPGLTADLERDLSLDDRILKFQTIKIANHVNPEELLQKDKEAGRKPSAPAEQTPESPEAAAAAPSEDLKAEEKADA